MSVYTQNYNIDGWPVCKDSEPMGRKDCLAELQKLEAQLAALKEENERLEAARELLNRSGVAMYSEIGALKARVAELEDALVAILEHDSPINIVDTATATERDIFDIARSALAAYREKNK